MKQNITGLVAVYPMSETLLGASFPKIVILNWSMLTSYTFPMLQMKNATTELLC